MSLDRVGSLTYDDLTDYMLAGSPYRELIPYDMVRQSELWEELIKSEYLCEIFKSVTWSQKAYIEKELEHRADPHQLGLHVELSLRVIEIYPELAGGILTTDRDKTIINLSRNERVSEEFFDLSQGFLKGVYGSFYNANPYDLDRCAIHLLRAIHGEKVVIPLLKRWLSENCSATTSILVAIADNWEILKEYPVEWSINVVAAEALQMQIGGAR